MPLSLLSEMTSVEGSVLSDLAVFALIASSLTAIEAQPATETNTNETSEQENTIFITNFPIC